jgi:hypothetical protein
MPRHESAGAAAQYDAMPARRRRPAALLVAALVVLLVVAAGVWWVLRPGSRAGAPAPANPTSSAAIPVPTGPRTLLTLITDDRGALLAGALLGVDEDAAQAVLLPADLRLDPTGGSPFAATMAAWPDGPRDAVSRALGVGVDGAWRLRPAALQVLVDSVGGVVVDVDHEVRSGDGVVVGKARGQRLAGVQAAAFAAFSRPGEPAEQRLARSAQVLDGILQNLPEDPAGVAELAGALEDSATFTGSVGELAGTLSALHDRVRTVGLLSEVVPLQASTTRLDAAAAQALIRRRMPQAVASAPPADAVRVLVLNGDGTPALANAARSRLADKGFQVTVGGNDGRLGQAATRVEVAAAGAGAQEAGATVAAALGLEAGAVQVTIGAGAGAGSARLRGADVRVVLGTDFAADVAANGV